MGIYTASKINGEIFLNALAGDTALIKAILS